MKRLKFIIPLLIVLDGFNIAYAQPTVQQQIEDSVIGWKTIYSFKGKQYKPLVAEGQSFTAYQQSLRDTFTSWIQKTYKPIAGWGDIFHKDYTTRQNKGPVPQGIGIDAMIYGLVEKNGRYQMIANEDHNDMSIYTNRLSGVNPVLLFNSTENFFFTMPKANYASTFTDKSLIDAAKEFGLHDGDRFSKYMVYFPSTWVTVVLTPGNKLPIVQLTKGEVLEQCERGFKREIEERKKEAERMKSNNPKSYAETIKYIDENYYPQFLKNWNTLKEKYKDKLNEPAALNNMQGPSFSDFVNSNTTLFVEDWYQRKDGFPVYRYTNEAIENSKKDKPLWISITWQAQKPNSLVKGYELHRAMQRYFNFDYAYDYFFNPEKVKGVPYTPSNAEEQAFRIKQLKSHYTKEEKPLPQGIFFADDFSDNTDGSRPKGWNDSKNRTPATIVSIKNKPGKWVQLGHMNELSPSTSLKKSLPENFTLEFDLSTDEFNVRTGGSVQLSLSSYPTNAEGWVVPNSKGTTLQWQIKSGNEADYNNNNYSGESRPIINSTIAGYEGSYNAVYSPREFSNKKTSLHAAVKVKNGQVSFFINGKQIATSSEFKQDYCKECVCKGIPPGTAFRTISFTNTTQNWSPDGKSNPVNVYINNVKILKD